MREVSTKVLKDQQSEWVRRAEQGERIIVSRSGRPVAALLPLSDLQATTTSTILADLASRGAVRLPHPRPGSTPFGGEPAASRGRLASDMVVEDRR